MIKSDPVEYQKPVLLVGGGDVNWPLLSSLVNKGLPVVAADGGANKLAEHGIDPQLIVGDLDSLDAGIGEENASRLLEISGQDNTDFEKTLSATEAPLYLAFGFLGRRFDHSLAALHSLIKYRGQKKIVLIDQVDMIWLPDPVETFKIDLPLGTRFSVYPLEPVSFQMSEGLQYPLDGLSLKQGTAIGTSNRVTGETVRIALKKGQTGAWAVIIPAEFVRLFIR